MTLKAMEDRRKAKNISDYSKINKEIRTMCRKAKEDWLNQKCLEIETMEMKQDLRGMHMEIKRTDTQKNVKVGGYIKTKTSQYLQKTRRSRRQNPLL
jgi:hypothetical protein